MKYQAVKAWGLFDKEGRLVSYSDIDVDTRDDCFFVFKTKKRAKTEIWNDGEHVKPIEISVIKKSP